MWRIPVRPYDVDHLERFAYAMSSVGEFRRSISKQEVHIQQIRIGRTRDEQIARAGEKRVGVIVVEGRARGASDALSSRDGARVDDGAGGIRRAVGAVGPGGERDETIDG